ncbi:hypothetical protein ACFYYR_14865 [Streptomyces sp. NPDC001922]|uniref:hypothetical protein n=1 Tax=Streptomyces sp. NPDC001922 TaxID=3364624 RepID=UPI0036D11A5E
MIPSRVVARIGARAAHEELARQAGSTPVHRGLTAPRSTATLHHGSVRLVLTLDLPYPIDIARASTEIQRHVTEQVVRLTGMSIDRVTLSVQQLVLAEDPASLRAR